MRVIEITDFAAPQLDIYARYSEAQLFNYYAPNGGIFIAESPKVIACALKAGYEPISALAEHKHVQGQAREILKQCGDIPVFTAEFDVLTKLTGFGLTRGMLCAMHRPKLPCVQQVCAGANRVVILENIMNPTNVGAIFRSAAALGFDAVILTRGCSDPLYRRAIRVSMGTVFQIPWTFFEKDQPWPDAGLALLRGMGFKTAAMALTEESMSIDDPQLMWQERLAVVLGTEGDGLARQTIGSCDYTVRIPMAHGVDSLNVAAASAVAFWQLRKK